MDSSLRLQLNLSRSLGPIPFYLSRPIRLVKNYNRENFRQDIIAGITVAVILLPQAIAFSLVAELPPQMGIFAAVVGSVVGALWGSSNQALTGPTNALSLLVLSALATGFEPGSLEFVIAAGLLAVMVGFFQLIMGLARLGVLINFVSHSVIVGFATGAGFLIAIRQLIPLLGLQVSGRNLVETIVGIIRALPSLQRETAILGIGSIIIVFGLRKINRKIPAALVAMVTASVVVFLFHLNDGNVAVIGELPASLPPLAKLPLFDLDFISRLSSGALAVGAIGLVQTMAISRSIANNTGQRIDSNQEFVGQGLANIAAGFFSGYPVSASFSISAVNQNAGAKTPLASFFTSGFVLIALFTLGPLGAYLPRAALSGVLIVVAVGIINTKEILRIWRGTRGDAVIMLVTFLGTLFLEIAFAVLLGIMLSFALYIIRTSSPRVHHVLPDKDFKHFLYQPEKPSCPQLAVIDILGDLYFGAVNHVEEVILGHFERNPDQRFLLIRMHNVNHCDFSGIHMLENVVKVCRDRSGDVFMVRVSLQVSSLMDSTGFTDYLGQDHFLSEEEAIGRLFHHVLDPATCIYECPVRAFKECQNLPKHFYPQAISFYETGLVDRECEMINPQDLRAMISNGEMSPLILDVREPREFKKGRIPQATLKPLPALLSDLSAVPEDQTIVFVCRSGRRSRLAAHLLKERGCKKVLVLNGGMLAWESSGLLEAVD
ncbi:MAG: SulP family inorganic anion transporter [Candidatus Promineifilaceae bacterium]